MQAKLQVHPSDPKGTTSGKDTLLSVLCLRTNKSHSSCSRTGFCIVQDAIPYEVDIENGSNRRIRQLVAQLQKRVVYTAQGHHLHSIKTIAEVASDPIEPGNSRSWQPPPLPVPDTEPTIASCSIIRVNYYLKIKASISGAINPHVDFVLFLGNVPLSGVEDATITQLPPPSKTCTYVAHCKLHALQDTGK